METNKRKFTRKPIDLDVTCEQGDVLINGKTIDISPNGIFIKLKSGIVDGILFKDVKPAIFEIFDTVRLKLNGGATIDASIRWNSRNGVGLQYTLSDFKKISSVF